VSILVFELILKLKTCTHNRGLGPNTCFLGSLMLVKVDLNVGRGNLVKGVGVFNFDFVLILKLKTSTHNRGLGPDTCILGSHMLVKVDLNVGRGNLVRG
jgi:ABC-type cobalamin transport system permease subunit